MCRRGALQGLLLFLLSLTTATAPSSAEPAPSDKDGPPGAHQEPQDCPSI